MTGRDRAILRAIGQPVRSNRDLEWWLSAVTVYLGVWLAAPMNTFSPLFVVLGSWAAESVWGYALFVTGLVNILALVVNGLHWITPRFRIACLSFEACTYGLMCYGIALVNPRSFGFGLLIALLFSCFVCIRRAAADDVVARAKRDAGINP